MRMKRLILALATLTALATPALAADNTLTPAETRAGWVLLFDGKTTDAWRGFKQAVPDPGWRAEDGVLPPTPSSPGTS